MWRYRFHNIISTPTIYVPSFKLLSAMHQRFFAQNGSWTKIIALVLFCSSQSNRCMYLMFLPFSILKLCMSEILYICAPIRPHHKPLFNTLFIYPFWNALLFLIRKYVVPGGSVNNRSSASPSYEAASHVNNYAYSGKLLLLLSSLTHPYLIETLFMTSHTVNHVKYD